MVVGVVGVGEFLSPVLMCLLLISVFFLSPFIIPRWLLLCRSIFLAGWLKKKRKKIYAVGFKVHRTVALYMCVIFHSSLSALAASLFPSRIGGGGGGVIFVQRDAGILFWGGDILLLCGQGWGNEG